MKTPLSLMFALVTTTALTEPWMLGVVRTFETLKPMLVRSVRPFAARKKLG
jgi:hypothetical protein